MTARRLYVTSSLPVVLVALAVLAAAVLGGGDGPARAAVSAATGPLVTTSAGTGAILVARDLRPGASGTGAVTVTNAGDSAGAFALAAVGLTDSSKPARLSRVLDLRIADVTPGRASRVLYAGKLADLARIDLGTLAQRAARRYRFTVAFPIGRAAALDNPYQGVSSSVTFQWIATATGAPRPTPAHTGQAPGARSKRSWRLRFEADRRQVADTGRITATVRSRAHRRVTITGTAKVGRVTLRLQRMKRRLAHEPLRWRVRVALPGAARDAVASGRPVTVRLHLKTRLRGRAVVWKRTVLVFRARR